MFDEYDDSMLALELACDPLIQESIDALEEMAYNEPQEYGVYEATLF